MNDNTPMPFGIHKGKKLANVPDTYLILLYETNKCGIELRAYIEENIIQYLKK